MTTMNTKVASVSEYVRRAPKASLPHLRVMRKELASLIPDGDEVMRYGIPTIQLDGKNIVHFGGYNTHIGFYPGSKVIAHFAKELAEYKTAKGTVQFSLDEKLPLPLIRSMTRYSITEHRRHGKTR